MLYRIYKARYATYYVPHLTKKEYSLENCMQFVVKVFFDQTEGVNTAKMPNRQINFYYKSFFGKHFLFVRFL